MGSFQMRMLDDHGVLVYGGTQLLKQSNATSVHLPWHLCVTGTGENNQAPQARGHARGPLPQR